VTEQPNFGIRAIHGVKVPPVLSGWVYEPGR